MTEYKYIDSETKTITIEKEATIDDDIQVAIDLLELLGRVMKSIRNKLAEEREADDD
jgi:hypothetical protein